MSRFPFGAPGDDLPNEATPPTWMVETLRAPVTDRVEARTRIMTRIRALPAPRGLIAPMPRTRWRRGTLSGLGGVALTAVLALMLTVREGERLSLASRVHATALVLGDSAVPAAGIGVSAPDADSVFGSVRGRLLDTMRVVEFVVRGAGLRDVMLRDVARQPAAALRTIALARISATEWRARTLVPRDAVDVTVVVNGVAFAVAPTPVMSPPR